MLIIGTPSSLTYILPLALKPGMILIQEARNDTDPMVTCSGMDSVYSRAISDPGRFDSGEGREQGGGRDSGKMECP